MNFSCCATRYAEPTEPTDSIVILSVSEESLFGQSATKEILRSFLPQDDGCWTASPLGIVILCVSEESLLGHSATKEILRSFLPQDDVLIR